MTPKERNKTVRLFRGFVPVVPAWNTAEQIGKNANQINALTLVPLRNKIGTDALRSGGGVS